MNLSVIIVSANRPRNINPPTIESAIKIGSKSLINKQCELLVEKFDNPQIILVSGFQADKINTKKSIKTIYNKNYNDTNAAYSLGLGLKAAKYKKVLVVLGGSVFNKASLEIEWNKGCKVLVNKDGDARIGCSSRDGQMQNMFFGLPNRWSGLFYVTGNAIKDLEKICLSNKKMFVFETINMLSERHPIEVKVLDKMKNVIIETNKDIEEAKKIR